MTTSTAGSSTRSMAPPISCTAFRSSPSRSRSNASGGATARAGRRFPVPGRTELVDTVIGCGMPHLGHGHHGNFLVELRNVMAEVSGIRRLGSASLDLAYVAAGRMDGFWEIGLSPWDIAAGLLLIREAGGFVSDMDG